jgi:Dna[CI] antecedent, DciA
VACRSAVWAQELELLGEDLTDRLNACVGAAPDARPVTGLRFVVRDP